jgi:hypothetical protein
MGMGAEGYWLSAGMVSCASKTPAPAQSATRTKMHIRPANDIRLRKWEVQLMGIATEEENGRSYASFLF